MRTTVNVDKKILEEVIRLTGAKEQVSCHQADPSGICQKETPPKAP